MFLLLGVAAAAAGDFDGAWRLVEARDAVQARVDAAVETALAPFNLLVRGIARPRLAAAATFCERYAMRRDEASFSVGCDAVGSIVAAFDAPPVPGASPEGRAYQLSARAEGRTVILDFQGDEGWQRTRYWVDDGVLHVEKTIHSQRLDTNVAWEMRYGKDK